MEQYNTFSYNVNEGLLESHVDDIAFDKNNFGWLSFSNGIQKFDGRRFTEVPIQPGLPDNKSVNLFSDNNKDIWLSHSLGISKYVNTNNRFQQVYKNTGIKISPLILGEDEGHIYFFTGEGKIIEINEETNQVTSESTTGFQNYLTGSLLNFDYTRNIINHRVGLVIDSSLVIWNLKKKEICYQIKMPNLSGNLVHLKNEHEILYYKYTPGKKLELYCYDFAVRKEHFITNENIDKTKAFRGVVFQWHQKKLVSVYNRLYVTDSSYAQYTSEIVNFQSEPVSGNAVINSIEQDNYGNLYLLTVNDGIRKIKRNNYDIKYYGTNKKESNFIISLCIDKKANRILAGTYGNGLLVFDTLQRLVKHVYKFSDEVSGFSPSGIIKINTDDYLLFCWGYDQVWRITNNFSTFTNLSLNNNSASKNRNIGYYGNVIFQNEQSGLFQTENSFFKIYPGKPDIYQYYFGNDFGFGAILLKNNIVSATNKELIFIDTATFAITHRIPFQDFKAVRCIETDKEGNIYVGCNTGLYKMDQNGKILFHSNKTNGLPDECIYAMVFDKDGFLWCSTNKGIVRLDNNKSILHLTKEDGLQENEFNTNVVAKGEKGEIFFGGVNGITSFYPSAIKNKSEKINLLVTGIRVNNKEIFGDTAVWNIENIDLPYNQNSVAFDLVAMGSNNPGQYIYQYKMKGIDESWSQSNALQMVHYFLPPGKYVFQMYASRSFNKEAKALKEIAITVHPPFWKTWWFISAVCLLLLAILVYSINQYNRKEYQKKILVLEGENKMRLERERISRDLHDNVGAYANAVLYKTELLQQQEHTGRKKEIISDLHFASKDIITSLRETVWALKKDNYSAEDCLMRIRNFIQPLTRYYPHINFKVEGDVPFSFFLQYDKALHLIRIVQEAVTNAIKHSGPKKIIIKSEMENNRWKLSVIDEGIGFNVQDKKQLQQGNGLTNMEERSVNAGFIFSITSVKDKGTVVLIVC